MCVLINQKKKKNCSFGINASVDAWVMGIDKMHHPYNLIACKMFRDKNDTITNPK